MTHPHPSEPTIPFPRDPTHQAHLLRRSSMPASTHAQIPIPTAPSNAKRSQSSSQQSSDSRLSHFLSMVAQSDGGKRGAAPMRIEDAVDLADEDSFSTSPVFMGSSWGSSGWVGPERRAASESIIYPVNIELTRSSNAFNTHDNSIPFKTPFPSFRNHQSSKCQRSQYDPGNGKGRQQGQEAL